MPIQKFSTLLFRWVCVCLVGGCAAQSTRIEGPVLGFLFDFSSRAIRPMLGIPGSASLGEVVNGGLDFGSVAPDGSWAAGIRENRVVVLQNLANGGSESTPAGAIAGVDGAVWATDSSAVVLYSSASHTLQRMTLEDGVPRAGAPLDLSNFASEISFIAAGRLGSKILVSVRNGAVPGLYSITGDAAPILVLPLADPGAVTIDLRGERAYALDRSTGGIWRLSAAQWQYAELILQDRELSGISALATTTEDILCLADPAKNRVRIYDLTQHQFVASLSVPEAPSVLDPLPGSGFVLNRIERAGTPVWLLELRPQASVLFIPGKQN